MTDEIGISVLALFLAYLLGSIPSAYLAGRLRKGIDIRQVGTHNMGAMNVFYQVGFAPGVLVLIADMGKGVAALALARWLGTPDVTVLLAGVAAIAGHSFPLWLKFRGGKGGATLIGIFFFLMPWAMAVWLPVLGLLLLLTRFPTFSYSFALLTTPFIAWLIYDSSALVAYSIGMLLLPGLQYIPRLKEIRGKAGNWRAAFLRKSFKDRM
jgi:glycerol-3-phosphate acyltransferase PlsY